MPLPSLHHVRHATRKARLPPSLLVRHASTNLPRPYRFHIGASWHAKPGDRAMRKVASPFPADHPIGKWRDESLTRGKGKGSPAVGPGEDFFYIQDVRFRVGLTLSSSFPPLDLPTIQMRNQSDVSLGIADGVGGWVTSGVDPSRFSQALMYHAHRYCSLGWAGEPEIDPTQEYEERETVEGWELLPMECMDMAHEAVRREKSVVAGSSTACIINMNASSGVLRAANLGDSGFLIIRSSSVFHRQRSQTHFFNCPRYVVRFFVRHSTRQLAKLPAFMGDHSGAMTDFANASDLYETKLRDGDLVIAFTDGLSDNVFNSEITSICSLVARGGGSEDVQVQAMANRIVDYARSCMNNMSRVSPFEKAAAREGQACVTVLVALVREVL
ncbi:phosphatase 2C-like domain-containing protein [Amylostereum chailletii]|nr:phosphatase 2C-like domain-containing protein [Amylostereum chailletii]